MKKFLALLLTVVMLTALIGCSKGAEPTRGTVEGDVYQNEYMGIKFTKPSSWVYSTDEEIATVMNLAADTFWTKTSRKRLKTIPRYTI